MILTLIYWQISFEKYVPKHLISLLYNFYLIFRRRYLIIWKKPILKTYPSKFMIFNVDYALKLSNFTSWKRFTCLKWMLKRFSTILLHLSSTTKHCRSPPLMKSRKDCIWTKGRGMSDSQLIHFCLIIKDIGFASLKIKLECSVQCEVVCSTVQADQ